jgi:hypothetical protein
VHGIVNRFFKVYFRFVGKEIASPKKEKGQNRRCQRYPENAAFTHTSPPWLKQRPFVRINFFCQNEKKIKRANSRERAKIMPTIRKPTYKGGAYEQHTRIASNESVPSVWKPPTPLMPRISR